MLVLTTDILFQQMHADGLNHMNKGIYDSVYYFLVIASLTIKVPIQKFKTFLT